MKAQAEIDQIDFNHVHDALKEASQAVDVAIAEPTKPLEGVVTQCPLPSAIEQLQAAPEAPAEPGS